MTETLGKAGAGQRKGAQRAPISLHPAFPFIVALWFAALLGIGSMMVPVALLEKVVEATGIASIIPQTAPPLGFTARFALAIAATVGGGVLGLLIARKVAGLHRREVPSPRFAQTVAGSGVNARRPISAHDELGETGLDGNSSRGRRALAIEVDEGPSELFEAAPLPGGPLSPREMLLSRAEPGDTVIEDLDIDGDETDDDLAWQQPADDPAFADDGAEPLELTAFAAPDPAAPATDAGQDFNAPGFAMLADADDAVDHHEPEAPVHFPFRHSIAAPQARQMFAPDTVEEPAAELLADVHFSPPSLAREAQQFAPPVDAPADPRGQAAIASRPASEPADFAAMAQLAHDMVDRLEGSSFAPASGETGTDDSILEDHVASMHENKWQDGELDDLGLVQLAQRLGSSIERRREARAARAAAEAEAARLAAIVPATAPAVIAPVEDTPAPVAGGEFDLSGDFAVAAAADAAEAMAAYFGKSATSAEPAPVAFSAPVVGDHAAAADPSSPAPAPLASVPAPGSAKPAAARQVFQPLTEVPTDPVPAGVTSMLGGMATIAIDEDEDEDEDADEAIMNLAASFSLPLSRNAPAPEAVQAAAPAPAPATAAASLASFNPFERKTQVFVRIENEPQPEAGHVEPAVVFPGTETRMQPHAPSADPQAGDALDGLPPLNGLGTVRRSFDRPAAATDGDMPVRGNPDENEKALREALLNLQRMSGAA